MTPNQHPRPRAHHDDHHHDEPWHELPAGFADHLALEAQISEPLRTAALDRAAAALTRVPSQIVDLGSGTGADVLALAARFPSARVHALDVSAALLDRTRTAAASSGLGDRLHVHPADLNGDWTSGLPTGVDLVWAASTLHHVEDPEATIRQSYAALRPGGILVLIELAGTARFEPADLGSDNLHLADRLSRVLTGGTHPDEDWSDVLEAAGFTTHACDHDEIIASADTSVGARYLESFLRLGRPRIVDGLDVTDVAAFDDLLGAIRTGRSSATFRAPRTVWIASRPLTDASTTHPADVDAPDPGAAEREVPGIDAAETVVDVAVLGGGPAGLAAAIALGRSRRTVAVIDDGRPRNAPADGAHNVLGLEGIAPSELLTRGRAEAETYGVQMVHGRADAVSGTIDDFTVSVSDPHAPVGGPQRIRARRIVLATGLVDDLPDVPGVRDGWGDSVLHCPFCHGWEVRDQRIAILTRDEIAVHQALLFRQLSDRVTVFLHEAPDPTDEQWARLHALGVDLVRPRVDHLVMEGSRVRGVAVDDGTVHNADAVVVMPRFNARTDLYESLGGTAESGPFGRYIPADARGATAITGVFSAGNASDPMAMVVASAAAGVSTGAAVHGDLAFADLERTVAEQAW